jgi:hypothetical protein
LPLLNFLFSWRRPRDSFSPFGIKFSHQFTEVKSPNCGKECIDFLFISTTQKNGPSIHNDILNTQFTDFRIFCKNFNWVPFLIAIVHVVMNGVCYKFAKAACKVIGQRLAFGLPLVLTTNFLFSWRRPRDSFSPFGIKFSHQFTEVKIADNGIRATSVLFDGSTL